MDRAEQLLKEKIEAVGELASIKSVAEEERAKANFNIKELEVSLSTLELENQVLFSPPFFTFCLCLHVHLGYRI
jgi:hypothetical protein